ncbi:hypothetical protein A3C96_01290 [Candidatus Uhrbacteria bacterium RIFCSPHIGHO2_02_FULL_60_10]|uniref:Peptidase M50 domain-containing protein n=1 Tax=Candidatus Uhrbacteria bacterium RIFCSPHIGHO2_02_FULL_60_10 TaxID=1802392 RepID=A0A1F7UA06_9BACT|nr:MAG: hypothetical protein A3C96_01290 [Candidatus Uhrbacteria bacterium RIFCSPHIGHO2_02_FULL_60_10]
MSRNISIAVAVATVTLISAVGHAGNKAADDRQQEYEWRPRTARLLTNLAALPAYALTQDFLHEGSHALWAVVQGHEVTAFKPYPHFEDYGGQHHFLFGSMAVAGVLTKQQEALMLAGPTITDLTIFTASDLLLTYGVSADAWYAPIIFMAGMLWPTIDWITTMNAWSPNTDVNRFCRLTGTNRVALTVVGDALIAVAVWRLLHHGKSIFLTKEPTAASRAVTVAPVIGGTFTGLALAGTF